MLCWTVKDRESHQVRLSWKTPLTSLHCFKNSQKSKFQENKMSPLSPFSPLFSAINQPDTNARKWSESHKDHTLCRKKHTHERMGKGIHLRVMARWKREQTCCFKKWMPLSLRWDLTSLYCIWSLEQNGDNNVQSVLKLIARVYNMPSNLILLSIHALTERCS